jgi:DNA polymerase-3 subunit gamma/tau
LKEAWSVYAEQKKNLPAEYQLLTQPITLHDKKIIMQLAHPVQETMLNNLKTEITGFLREKLKNNSITLFGELMATEDIKKMIYTNREKLDHLIEKNPLLKELKERFNLDTDF